MPDYFGIFIDELALNVDTLYLFLHQANLSEQQTFNYSIKANNVVWINLGIKNKAWSRDLFHQFKLSNFKNEFKKLDALLVRTPTPYGPYINRYIDEKKIVYMIVGDYTVGAKFQKIRGLRDRIINYYLHRNSNKFYKVLNGANILVNSNELFEKYKSRTTKIELIRTTTLTSSDFFERVNTCEKSVIQLLYTGRIDPAKGLFDLFNALLILNLPQEIILNIVGWDDDINQKTINELKNFAAINNISNKVIFHGKKSIGAELNNYYRSADIYVFPTHFEGFPRTIWEAMANSLPVVTTPVGGIPFVLQDKNSAIFAESKNAKSIAESIQIMIENRELRKQIISNAFHLAKENTLDVQTRKLINHVKLMIE